MQRSVAQHGYAHITFLHQPQETPSQCFDTLVIYIILGDPPGFLSNRMLQNPGVCVAVAPHPWVTTLHFASVAVTDIIKQNRTAFDCFLSSLAVQVTLGCGRCCGCCDPCCSICTNGDEIMTPRRLNRRDPGFNRRPAWFCIHRSTCCQLAGQWPWKGVSTTRWCDR